MNVPNNRVLPFDPPDHNDPQDPELKAVHLNGAGVAALQLKFNVDRRRKINHRIAAHALHAAE